MGVAHGGCGRAVRRGAAGGALSEGDCRPWRRRAWSRRPEAEVVRLGREALRDAVRSGSASVDNPCPGDDVRPAVEARLATASAVAAVAEYVELGDRPARRCIDGIVTVPRIESAAVR